MWFQNRRTKHKRVQTEDELDSSNGGQQVKKQRLNTDPDDNESDGALESDIDVEDDDDDVDIDNAESAFFRAQFHRGPLPPMDTRFPMQPQDSTGVKSVNSASMGHQGLIDPSRTPNTASQLHERDHGNNELDKVKRVKTNDTA